MIDRIVIENFKSLRRVALSLGRVNLFIGANASGKSNFLDALRVLQGIGNGFTVSEILDGKPKGATSEVWAGIRGGSARTCFVRADAERPDACVAAPDEVAMEVGGTLAERLAVSWDVVAPAIPASDPRLRTLDAWPTWRFLTRFSPATGRITRDRLDLGEHNIYDMPAHGSNSHTAVPLSAYGNGLGTLCAGMIGIVEKTNQTQEKPSPWLTIIQYSRRCSSWCRDMSSRAWHASTSRDGWPVA